MFRSVVWQLVHGQSGGMPWIRIEEEIREIFKTPQGRLRGTLCLGLKHPRVGRPFRARRLMSLHPGLKHLGYSVRPLRGHAP
jgi:hypothetical protein